jgi:dTDP-D-glucose 4,6-dehydratase
MKNLLVTGGAGFIGSNFVRYMLEKYPSYQIVVLDKLTYAGNLDNLKDVAERFAGRYTLIQGDIADAAAVEAAMQAHDVDTIVNFAAETHVDRSHRRGVWRHPRGPFFGRDRPAARPQPLLGQQGRRRPALPGLP